jgi:hypothetical protein
MNINFIYDNFDISGKNHANLEYSFNDRTWFDSSNFFSSYLNDSESGFDYWYDKERFQIRKHPLESILNKPNDVYFYMISHAGSGYHELADFENLGISSRIIKRLRTNKNFYLVFILEHECDSISGLNIVVDKINKLGIDNKTIICNNNSKILDIAEKIKKLHNFDTKITFHELNFLTWSTWQVLSFEDESFNAPKFEWTDTRDGKFFMCRNRGGKPHRLAMLAFLQSNKKLRDDTNWSYIGTSLYGDLVRNISEYFSKDFMFENAYEILGLETLYKEDDFENGLGFVNKESREFETGDLAPIYLVPEHHESFRASYFNIVTESLYQSKIDAIHLTEKTFRPFYYFQYPIFLASPGHVQHLRSMGFDLFDDIIDHSYDNIENDKDRFQKFINELDKIHSNKDFFVKNYKSYKQRFLNNRDVFKKVAYNGKVKDVEFFMNLTKKGHDKLNNKFL